MGIAFITIAYVLDIKLPQLLKFPTAFLCCTMYVEQTTDHKPQTTDHTLAKGYPQKSDQS